MSEAIFVYKFYGSLILMGLGFIILYFLNRALVALRLFLYVVWFVLLFAVIVIK